MAHINDHEKRHAYYKGKAYKNMNGKIPAARFNEMMNDTLENVLEIIDNLEKGVSTYADARLDVLDYKENISNIWLGIEHGKM